MRPLPTSPEALSTAPTKRSPAPLHSTLELGPSSTSSNQKRGNCPTQKAYPWLLTTSTLLAGVFCYLYLSKPVIQTQAGAPGPAGAATPALAATAPSAIKPALPSDSGLPGDPSERPEAVAPGAMTEAERGRFEETNLRIQHVLGATGPQDENLGKITLDVPVLYESGTVRWTETDVAEARELLSRIRLYQTKARALREEAVGLISEWDGLVVRSIPETTLRADSPTLPENQGVGTAGEAPLNSTEAIEIESP